jgi:peroxiredoxin
MLKAILPARQSIPRGLNPTKEDQMAAAPPLCNFGWKAAAFSLPGVDGKTYNLEELRGPRGTLVMFICNHCPYVTAVIDRIVRDVRALESFGIKSVAICSNDAMTYPEDSFANMQHFAAAHGMTYPYLHDETQDVARAYDAVCTPDFFGFNADLELQYRGRLDESRKDPAAPDARRELVEAMRLVAETGRGPEEQKASMGCSIKWKMG